LAIEWAAGLRARALLRSELEARLVAAGLDAELAREAAELLGRSGELRLAGSAAERDAVTGLLARVQKLVKRLLGKPQQRARTVADEARA
jgi:hypothetical protein